MAQFKAIKVCAICGGEATTVDHIPPQSLYPKPRRPNLRLHSVPACKSCNNGASSDDEEFKMVIGISTGEVQENLDAVVTSLLRTMAENKRLDDVIQSGERTFSIDNGRLVQGPVKIVFNRPRYEKVVERMIRGLYWRQTKRPLGLDAEVDVLDPSNFPPEFEQQLRDLLPMLPRHVLNDKTFCYKVCFSQDGSSIWGLQFFGKHTVFGIASPPPFGSMTVK
jgi:hypothetical protein